LKAADRLVLPSDLVIVGADSFAVDVRDRMGAKEGDRVITRARSRARSLVVDARSAAFLEQFRSPSTLVEAVMRHAAARGEDPGELLEAAAPLALRLYQRQLMVTEGDARAAAIQPTFACGAEVAGAEISYCVHIFEDVEVYRGRLRNGDRVALKILRPEPSVRSRQMIAREVAILAKLGGVTAPELLGAGELEGRPYVVQSWCDGIDVVRAAAVHRRISTVPFSPQVLALCASILHAYADIHSRGVVHGDVHPGNVRIGKDGTLTLLDFGIARGSTDPQDLPIPDRGGLHEYVEPEYCTALLRGEAAPPATSQSDQYCVGALIYLLLTGSARQDFSLDYEVWLRQVASTVPLSFEMRQCEAWSKMESVLARALSINPADRFDSMADFLSAFEDACAGKRAGKWSRPTNTDFLAAVLRRTAPEDFLFGDEMISQLPAPRCSINYGAAGVAWFLYRMACMRDEPRLLSTADFWCTRAGQLSSDVNAFADSEIGVTREVTGGISPFHSLSGVHLVQSHVSRAMGDVDSAARAAHAFVKACEESCDNLDLTVGWTSVLLGCAALIELLPRDEKIVNGAVMGLGRETALRIAGWMSERSIKEQPSMRWLGFAHGWAGLLFGLLRWTEATGDRFSAIGGERLSELAAFGSRQGDVISWPVLVNGGPNQRGPFTGWCHGSAGYLLLWILAHRILGDDRFLRLARGSACHIATGINGKSGIDPSLCCGYAGQGFAMLAFHRTTGESELLRLASLLSERAVQFASNTTRPGSLYKGDVGVALLIQELSQPCSARMPLVEAL
jgi:eukaryotic-like serine/threonine-protein kinase